MMSMGMINNKYKTSICRHFEQTGICQLGIKCHFAHGKEELRKVTDPIPVASAALARTPIPTAGMPGYPVMGYCKNNQNCSFAHGDIDLRLPTQDPSLSAYTTAATTQQFVTPLLDSTVQNQIAQQQIQYLIQQMDEYHQKNAILMASIKNAEQLNSAGNTQAAAKILYEIIQRPDRSAEDTEKYNEFLAAIQQLGNTLYQSIQLSFSQSLLSSAYQGMNAYGTSSTQSSSSGENSTSAGSKGSKQNDNFKRKKGDI